MCLSGISIMDITSHPITMSTSKHKFILSSGYEFARWGPCRLQILSIGPFLLETKGTQKPATTGRDKINMSFPAWTVLIPIRSLTNPNTAHIRAHQLERIQRSIAGLAKIHGISKHALTGRLEDLCHWNLSPQGSYLYSIASLTEEGSKKYAKQRLTK